MRDNHKLTVAIPTYNRANYLRYAIDSVLSQSYEDFELIILDNASEDDTKSVVEFFKDDRIQYIRNNINIGMEKNFNKAIEESKGEYLIVLSDDDVMDSNLLMEEVNILDNNTDVIVVSANCSIIDENGFIFQEKCMNMDNDVIFDRFDYIKQSLEGRYFLPFPATMIKLTMLRQEGIKFNTSVGPCCDAYLWYELNTYSKKIYLLKKPLLQYRKHSERYTIKSGGLYYENLILWEHTFNNKAISEDPYIRTLIQKRINRIMLDLLDKVIYEQNEELFIRCLTKINNLIENNGLLLEPKIFLISYFDNYFLNLDGINPLLSTTVSKLYYKWYTLARLGQAPIKEYLEKLSIKKVAIFGSTLTAYLLFRELNSVNIQVVSFLYLDNKPSNSSLKHIPIYPLSWIQPNYEKVDAIITTIEGEHESQIINVIKDKVSFKEIKVLSWKDALLN